MLTQMVSATMGDMDKGKNHDFFRIREMWC